MPKFVVTQRTHDGHRFYEPGHVLELEPKDYFRMLSTTMEPHVDDEGNVDEEAKKALKAVRKHKHRVQAFNRIPPEKQDEFNPPEHPFPLPDKSEAREQSLKALAAERKEAMAELEKSKVAGRSGRAADQQ